MNALLALWFAAAVVACGASGTPARENVVPRFEPSTCPIDLPAAETALCGYLVVYEKRATRTKTIRLPVITLKTASTTPKPDPVLRTLGGPGGSSLRLARGRSASPWLRNRDYIVFEQRGTKYAQPSLECPEVDSANIESAKLNLARKPFRRREIAAAKACLDRLSAAGIDLSAYNSVESAADIEDLRRVLGFEKINLYGVSYSARLMLSVMRYFPAGIRSVVLESTLPPEVNYDEHGVDGIVRTLDVMFKGCRQQHDCNTAYPELEKKFYATVARLNRDPIDVSVKPAGAAEASAVRLNGDDFATWIADYFFSNEPAATAEAPYVIELAARGNFEGFQRYAADKMGPSSYSWGMRYSVWCSEEMPFESRKKIRAQSSKFAGLKGYEVMALPAICSVWKVKPVKPVENQPVKSDIPTLILAAEYDAYTPPEWGRTAGRSLTNSFFFEVPWAGHGPAFSVRCVGGMLADFFDDPRVPPSSDCIQQTRSKFKFLVKTP